MYFGIVDTSGKKDGEIEQDLGLYLGAIGRRELAVCHRYFDEALSLLERSDDENLSPVVEIIKVLVLKGDNTVRKMTW